jgi:hypothetical protein
MDRHNPPGIRGVSIFFGGGAGFLLSFLDSTKSVNVLTCALKTSISDCEEAEAEVEGRINIIKNGRGLWLQGSFRVCKRD